MGSKKVVSKKDNEDDKMEIIKGICPKCQSSLGYESLDIEEESVFYPVFCPAVDCDFEGKEYCDISYESLYDNDGKEVTE